MVTLIQPTARLSKHVCGAGRWRVQRTESGRPFYCLVLHDGYRVQLRGHRPIVLQRRDSVLIPAAHVLEMTSFKPPTLTGSVTVPLAIGTGGFRMGTGKGTPDVRRLLGHCYLSAPDADLLVAVLPRFVHVSGARRLSTLAKLVSDEARAQPLAIEVMLARLLEVLFIEALRSGAGDQSTPGLVRVLADGPLARAIRRMHENPMRPWTVSQLAQSSALSRSAFFERFSRIVGVAPMQYLLAWRMSLARRLLQDEDLGVAQVAERVGYSSGSTFSAAFTRHVGLPPSRYARQPPTAGGT